MRPLVPLSERPDPGTSLSGNFELKPDRSVEDIVLNGRPYFSMMLVNLAFSFKAPASSAAKTGHEKPDTSARIAKTVKSIKIFLVMGSAPTHFVICGILMSPSSKVKVAHCVPLFKLEGNQFKAALG